MNIFKLINALEGLIYDLALWVFLIPKTLIHVVISPAWVVSYVPAELEKPLDKRFNEYVSPIILWLVIAVIPYLWVAEPIFNSINYHDFETKILIVAVGLISYPLGFAVGVLAVTKKSISKTEIQPDFYTQCYLFTPFYLLILPVIVSFSDGDYGYLEEPMLRIGLILLAFFWILISEVIFVRIKFRFNIVKSTFMAIVLLFAGHMLFVGIGTAITLAIAIVSG